VLYCFLYEARLAIHYTQLEVKLKHRRKKHSRNLFGKDCIILHLGNWQKVLFAGAEGHRYPFRGHAFRTSKARRVMPPRVKSPKLNNNHIHLRSNVSVKKFLFLLRCRLVELQALSEVDGSGAAKFLNDHSRLE
jgi:hypothetical protein